MIDKKISVYIPIDFSGIYSFTPYIAELVESLELNNCDVKHSLFRLSKQSLEHQIVNFQWPEAIFGWREPKPEELDWIEQRLKEMSKISKIVTTIHNLAPHYRNTAGFSALYKLVYKYSDAYVHLGRASVEALYEHYPVECTNKIHRVIPSGNYNAFGKAIEQHIARSQFQLPLSGRLVLVVGALRNAEELDLIADSLPLWVDRETGLILAATVGFKPALRLKTLLKRLRYEVSIRLHMHILSRKKYMFLKPGPIPHDQMAALVCAADVVLIPRLQGLNSGNVALGFTYGKVVVGPDVGVVGQTLKDAGNPVFKPEDGAKGVAAAVKAGIKLASVGHGQSNERTAQAVWDWGNVAMQYRKLYEELLG